MALEKTATHRGFAWFRRSNGRQGALAGQAVLQGSCGTNRKTAEADQATAGIHCPGSALNATCFAQALALATLHTTRGIQPHSPQGKAAQAAQSRTHRTEIPAILPAYQECKACEKGEERPSTQPGESALIGSLQFGKGQRGSKAPEEVSGHNAKEAIGIEERDQDRVAEEECQREQDQQGKTQTVFRLPEPPASLEAQSGEDVLQEAQGADEGTVHPAKEQSQKRQGGKG